MNSAQPSRITNKPPIQPQRRDKHSAAKPQPKAGGINRGTRGIRGKRLPSEPAFRVFRVLRGSYRRGNHSQAANNLICCRDSALSSSAIFVISAVKLLWLRLSVFPFAPSHKFGFASGFGLREPIAKLAAKRRKRRKKYGNRAFSCAFCAFSRLFPAFAITSRVSDFRAPAVSGPQRRLAVVP